MAEPIRVSSIRTPGFYVHQAKEVMKNSGNVDLHGLGNAITIAVRAADSLVSLGYAQVESFTTSIVDDGSDRTSSKPKVAIRLVKTGEFDSKYEEFKNSRVSK